VTFVWLLLLVVAVHVASVVAGVWWGRRSAQVELTIAQSNADAWRVAWRAEHLARIRLAHELEQERADRVECARVDEVAS
jgi:type II secretory pathway component PulK